MKCFRCERAAPEFTLYRINAKGRPGIWACAEHRIETDTELDEIIAEIERKRAFWPNACYPTSVP